jgi:hypothetical protein
METEDFKITREEIVNCNNDSYLKIQVKGCRDISNDPICLYKESINCWVFFNNGNCICILTDGEVDVLLNKIAKCVNNERFLFQYDVSYTLQKELSFPENKHFKEEHKKEEYHIQEDIPCCFNCRFSYKYHSEALHCENKKSNMDCIHYLGICKLYEHK